MRTADRARQRPAPVGHPPTDRIDLLDAQRPPRPRSPPSAHPARTPRPDRLQAAGLQRRDLAQLALRAPPPPIRRSHRLNDRGINHLVAAVMIAALSVWGVAHYNDDNSDLNPR